MRDAQATLVPLDACAAEVHMAQATLVPLDACAAEVHIAQAAPLPPDACAARVHIAQAVLVPPDACAAELETRRAAQGAADVCATALEAVLTSAVPANACAAARARARASTSAVLTVQSVKEYGYNPDTMKLSVHGLSSCLRLYKMALSRDPDAYEQHVKRAAAAFAAQGLAPAIYAAGSGWSLEPWLGPTLESSECSPNDMQALGHLLAALHCDVPTAWFEATAQTALRDFPAVRMQAQLLSLAPHAAARLAFGLAAGRHMHDEVQIRMLADTSNAELLQHWAAGGTALAPRHPAARRIVTVHGDAHPRNLVRMAEGEERLVFIDLELACVTQAVHDLALVLREVTAHGKTTNAQARENEQVLLRAYLLASGFAEPDASELEELVLDCRIAYFCGLYLRPRNLPCEPAQAAAVVACVHNFAAHTRVDESIRRSVTDVPHCASFFAETLGTRVHELGGLCKRAWAVPGA